MGKVILVLIGCGIIYTGYNIASWFSREELEAESMPSAEREAVQEMAPPVAGSQLVAPKQEPEEEEDEVEPWPVLSSSSEWVLIESWGFVRKGQELPGGAILEGWTEASLIVRTDQGKVPQRMRRPLEALKQLAGTVAMAAPIDEPVQSNPFAGPEGADK